MDKEKGTPLSNWETQVRKGALDYIILLCLHKREQYGYEMIKTIKNVAGLSISEGTIYPLLNRLKKDAVIDSRWVEMDTGIPRKYYRITEKGLKILKEMKISWKKFNDSLGLLSEEKT
ncbi:MAG: PadR family transcriptional regulator [Candidatus Aminicenantes bacterium]|nr:PadR family transcriptional regulator [Candidatus Aminicenantes bacterium]